MALRSILKVCDRDTGYEGGGRRQDPLWRQTASRKQLSATLTDILAAEMEWRWKSGRCGGGGRDRDAEESEDREGSDGS